MTGQLQLILQKELKLLADATEVLTYSHDKCSRIGVKASYLPEELESFESYSGRFARLSDILIQKVFRFTNNSSNPRKNSLSAFIVFYPRHPRARLYAFA